jgi:hypothetical protein
MKRYTAVFVMFLATFAIGQTAPTPVKSAWTVTENRNPMDDSKSTTFSLPSGDGTAWLVLVCGPTKGVNLIIGSEKFFEQGLSLVQFRVNDEPAFTKVGEVPDTYHIVVFAD